MELERTEFGTFTFQSEGVCIHDPASSSCGRFRWTQGDDFHTPEHYGFEPVNGDGVESTGTPWRREFTLDGQPVVMTVKPDTDPGKGGIVQRVRIEVVTQDGRKVASWLQDEGAMDDCPPTLVD